MAGPNRVVPPLKVDPDGTFDSRYWDRNTPLPEGPQGPEGPEGPQGPKPVIVSTEEPLDGDNGDLWYNPEGVPEIGDPVGLTKTEADQYYPSKDQVDTLAAQVALVDTREFDARKHGFSKASTNNIPAINAAIAEAAAAGGGRVVLPGSGVFTIRPDIAPIAAASNVTLDLGDTILMVADNANPYNAVILHYGSPAARLRRFAIRGGMINQNSEGQSGNNIIPGGATPGHGVRLYNIDIVDISGVEFVGGGTNFILVNDLKSEARIDGCRFQFVQAASSIPDYDHSAIYMEAFGQRVTGNRFFSKISEAARGAIEVHGTSGVVANNIAEQYQTLVNVTSPDPGIAPMSNDSIMAITGNTLERGNYGIRLWPYANRYLRKVNISDNVLDIAQRDWDMPTACGIGPATGGELTGMLEDVRITDNVVYFQRGDTRAATASGAAIQPTGTFGIGTSGHAGPSTYVYVDSNLVANAPTFGYVMGEAFHGTTTSDCHITRNTARNCGLNTAMGDTFRAAYVMRGIVVGGEMDRNAVEDTGAVTHEGKYSFSLNPTGASIANRLTDPKVTTRTGTAMMHSVGATVFYPLRRRTISIGTIPARGSYTIAFSIPGCRPSDTAMGGVRGGPPVGISWSCYSLTNEAYIRVVNVTDADIAMPAGQTWTLRVVPNDLDLLVTP